MACSKFEYVKHFENHTTLLRNTWIVVRLDGHSFHRFTSQHNFLKPNDPRALHLASFAAQKCMEEFEEIVLAYGQSDEFSFLLRRSASLYKRREAKITSTLCSLFTSNYVFYWNKFFGPETRGEKDVIIPGQTLEPQELLYPPSFDARAYNTAFWALVQDKDTPHSEQKAQAILKDTDSAAKNELLFSKYHINYNTLPEMYKKGSTLFRKPTVVTEVSSRDGREVQRTRNLIITEHRDIIGDPFWKGNPQILQA
ncbi:tRNA-histidine guanylyltransferase 1-like [Rhizophlyctis rosea]|uniref:tRNA(His) guanylyltransferase n=1 Tax=Rhizophlyctis rosea TaxID=64517 RepID=A0AAD5X6X0_9FUNG|nr:tRNA-histidine guanylyltransferase 1-like [Rhizophlyctis rosea]